MKEYATEHHQHALAVRIGNADAKNGSIDLTFLDPFADLRRRKVLESFLKSIREICHSIDLQAADGTDE